jgi:Fic family protein
MQQDSDRAGKYVRQITGYSAFVPRPLPPVPPIEVDDETLDLLSIADRALGRLDGSTEVLPNPDLFVMMYVRKEAVLSSQIEGTQASLADVLELEAKVLNPDSPSDVADVLNYVRALDYGMERLKTLPMSLRLICEIHERLMEGNRGQERNPGEFRRSQNWIGPQGCNLNTARYVPPAPDDMKNALGDWEKFLHDSGRMPILFKVGLAHSQFESIHPFLDGNGRIGRLMITFLLCEQDVLRRPMLYLSHFFKQNQTEYYDRLQAVRDKGEWEAWLKFFLRGIGQVAAEATQIARRILAVRDEQRGMIQENFGRTTADALKLHEILFGHPYVTIASVQKELGKAFPASSGLVKQMVRHGILKEVSGKARNRVFLNERYFELFNDTEVHAAQVMPVAS